MDHYSEDNSLINCSPIDLTRSRNFNFITGRYIYIKDFNNLVSCVLIICVNFNNIIYMVKDDERTYQRVLNSCNFYLPEDIIINNSLFVEQERIIVNCEVNEYIDPNVKKMTDYMNELFPDSEYRESVYNELLKII